jgi:hypothetical protein
LAAKDRPQCKSLQSDLHIGMRTAAKCLALLALAQGAAAFAPFSALPIRNHALPATCAPRSLPVASRNARDMPLRLSGLQMAATNVPITITGTNIEVRVRNCKPHNKLCTSATCTRQTPHLYMSDIHQIGTRMFVCLNYLRFKQLD